MGTVGFNEADWIWRDGEFVRWEDANLHLLSTAVQFGTSVFEGIRAYETERGPALFRLDEHVRRLFDSAKVYRMTPPELSPDDVRTAILETVRKNDLVECYVRPMILRGYGAAGIDPYASPIDTYIAAWPWGAYLGEEALSRGVDVCVSSWWRAHPNTYPTASKAGGHYTNAQLMKLESTVNGYDDAIAVGPGGLVSEGSGMNLFLVRDGRVLTPFLDGTSLHGITRLSVIRLALDLGFEVREQDVPRESLYMADELFFTGTAAEVTPIRSVDRIPVGEGKAGPVTLAIQERFIETVRGNNDDPHGFLTYL